MRYINGSDPSTFVDITASGVLQVDTIQEFTVGASVSFPNDLKTDSIGDVSGNGTAISSVLLHSGTISDCTTCDLSTHLMTDVILEHSTNNGVEIDSVLCKDNAVLAANLTASTALSSDVLNEYSSGSGCTVDSMLIKDGYIQTMTKIDSGTFNFVNGTNTVNLGIGYSLYGFGKLRILTLNSMASPATGLGSNKSMISNTSFADSNLPTNQITQNLFIYNNAVYTSGGLIQLFGVGDGRLILFVDSSFSNFSNSISFQGASITYTVA